MEEPSSEGFGGGLLASLGLGAGLPGIDTTTLHLTHPSLAAQLAAAGFPSLARPAQPALEHQNVILQLLQQQLAVAPVAGNPLLSLLAQVLTSTLLKR